MTQLSHPPPNLLLAYLRLFRAPNVFTAIADVAMGYMAAAGGVRSWLEVGLLTIVTALMYSAGMVLNDVFDFEVDRLERPQRPLPSGQIGRSWAQWLGWELLIVGLGVAWLAGLSTNHSNSSGWGTGAAATLLAACIVLYDGGLKRTAVGPLFMGLCRFFNILMGMSLAGGADAAGSSWAGWSTAELLIAAAIGIYIVGVTVFARSEATQSARGMLLLGMGLIAAGLTILALFPALSEPSRTYRLEPNTVWPLLVLVLSIWILRRGAMAIRDPSPSRVQSTIKLCLMSLIILDASVVLLTCSAPLAVGVLSLLIPAVVLGRWVYST